MSLAQSVLEGLVLNLILGGRPKGALFQSILFCWKLFSCAIFQTKDPMTELKTSTLFSDPSSEGRRGEPKSEEDRGEKTALESQHELVKEKRRSIREERVDRDISGRIRRKRREEEKHRRRRERRLEK